MTAPLPSACETGHLVLDESFPGQIPLAKTVKRIPFRLRREGLACEGSSRFRRQLVGRNVPDVFHESLKVLVPLGQILPGNSENEIPADPKTLFDAGLQRFLGFPSIMQAPQPPQDRGRKTLDPQADTENPPGFPKSQVPLLQGVRVGLNANLGRPGEGKSLFKQAGESFPLLRVKAGRSSPADVKSIDDRFSTEPFFPGSEFKAKCLQVAANLFRRRGFAVKGAIPALAAAERDMQVAGKPCL